MKLLLIRVKELFEPIVLWGGGEATGFAIKKTKAKNKKQTNKKKKKKHFLDILRPLSDAS